MGNNFFTISSINVRLETKIIKDGGIDSVSSASSGKTVNFNKSFAEVREIQVTAEGNATTKRTAFYEFAGGANPTSFKVFIIDDGGTFQTGNFSWHAEGI